MAPCDRNQLALPSGSRAFELVVVGSLEVLLEHGMCPEMDRNGIYEFDLRG